jgi:hypothetical protein
LRNNPNVPKAQYCFDVVTLLVRKGLVNAAFFDSLIQERPKKREEIEGLKELWSNVDRNRSNVRVWILGCFVFVSGAVLSGIWHTTPDDGKPPIKPRTSAKPESRPSETGPCAGSATAGVTNRPPAEQASRSATAEKAPPKHAAKDGSTSPSPTGENEDLLGRLPLGQSHCVPFHFEAIGVRDQAETWKVTTTFTIKKNEDKFRIRIQPQIDRDPPEKIDPNGRAASAFRGISPRFAATVRLVFEDDDGRLVHYTATRHFPPKEGSGRQVERGHGPREESPPWPWEEKIPLDCLKNTHFVRFIVQEEDPFARRSSQDDPGGFDLRLMSWGDGSGAPTSGKNLVVVGTDDNGLLHIRIFDAAGNRVNDTDATQRPAQAAAIATLKQQLPGLLPPHELTDAEKAQVIAEATSIVGQTYQGLLIIRLKNQVHIFQRGDPLRSLDDWFPAYPLISNFEPAHRRVSPGRRAPGQSAFR